MELNTLKDLLIDEIKDIYSAEKQITKALPKMIKAATSPELRQGFELHLEQTNNQIERLERIAEVMQFKPTGKTCNGMKGVLEEGSEIIEEDAEPEVKDAGLISAAQRVEHYEIAAYGTVRTYAELLGLDEVVQLLEQTLEEEKQTDEKLTDLAQEINLEAMEDDEDEEEDLDDEDEDEDADEDEDDLDDEDEDEDDVEDDVEDEDDLDNEDAEEEDEEASTKKSTVAKKGTATTTKRRKVA